MLPRLLDWLRQDLGYAVRSLVRSPGFTVLALLTLGLGVGANAAVFSLLDRLFGQTPAGVTEPDGLRRLYIEVPNHPFQPGMIFPFWNYPAFSAVDEAVRGAGEVAGFTPSAEGVVQTEGAELTVRRSYVTHDYFSVLGVRAARGRLIGAEEARVDIPSPVAVISHSFWESTFGQDPAILGRTLAIDSVSYTIIGVTERGFSGLDLSFTDVFLPLGTFPAQGQLGLPWYQWIGNYLRAVARLSPTSSDAVLAERASAGFQRRILPERGAASKDTSDRVLAGPIVAARGVGRETGTPEERQALAVSVRAAGVSAIVLLIACANVAGLVLVRTSRRRREVAMRLALGISRGRLAAQLVTEGVVLGALVAIVAVLLGTWGGTILRALLLPEVAWANAVLDRRLLVFAIGAALALGVLSAIAPALQSARLDVTTGLKGSGTTGAPVRFAFRGGLVITQAALAVVLLIGAGLFIESLRNLGALRLGFDVERLAWISPGRPLTSDSSGAALRDAVERLSTIPSVSGVARAQSAPMRGYMSMRIFLSGGDSLPIAPEAYPAGNSVSPEFFAVTGMQIRQGRGFEPGEQGVVVVSETMSRTLWPGEGALGKCLIFGEPAAPCLPVIGVVEDSRRRQIIEEPTLQYFLPRAENTAGGTILLRVDRQRWEAVAASVPQILERSFDTRSLRTGHMTATLEPQLRPWRLGAQLFTAFGALALLVTVVGVYGVMAYTVTQRNREIGVRMAIGARPHDVLRLILGEGLRTVSIGVVVGIALAVGSGRLIESLLYGVTPRDPGAVAAAAVVLLATAAAASLVPAWRAARVDPSATLREE